MTEEDDFTVKLPNPCFEDVNIEYTKFKNNSNSLEIITKIVECNKLMLENLNGLNNEDKKSVIQRILTFNEKFSAIL